MYFGAPELRLDEAELRQWAERVEAGQMDDKAAGIRGVDVFHKTLPYLTPMYNFWVLPIDHALLHGVVPKFYRTAIKTSRLWHQAERERVAQEKDRIHASTRVAKDKINVEPTPLPPYIISWASLQAIEAAASHIMTTTDLGKRYRDITK